MKSPELDARAELLLELPYWIVDFLPERAPADQGQYSAVERYFLEPAQVADLRARLAHVLLRLNCYHDLWVWSDVDPTWTRNPAPHELVDLLSACVPAEGGPRRINVLVGDGEALLTLDSDDLCATLYGPSPWLLDLVRTLAQTEGLCVWQPPQE